MKIRRKKSYQKAEEDMNRTAMGATEEPKSVKPPVTEQRSRGVVGEQRSKNSVKPKKSKEKTRSCYQAPTPSEGAAAPLPPQPSPVFGMRRKKSFMGDCEPMNRTGGGEMDVGARRNKKSMLEQKTSGTNQSSHKSKAPARKKKSSMLAASSPNHDLTTSISTRDVDSTFYRNKSQLFKAAATERSARRQMKKSVRDVLPLASPASTSTKESPKAPKILRGNTTTKRKKQKKPLDYLEIMDRHYKNFGPKMNWVDYRTEEIEEICRDAKEIFEEEPVLIDVHPPYVIVGDIHGQFNDLVNMFLFVGRPPQTRYLFLGDYVDRGLLSIETIVLLLCYKVYYPEDVILLRGNHECGRINRNYGFLDEIQSRSATPEAGEQLWQAFQDAFNEMPVSALVAGRIFCMHGGLSPNLTSLDQLRDWPKPLRSPSRGVINDLMWSDPEPTLIGWRSSSRGSGFLFGEEQVEAFCRRFDIDVIVRAHQLQLAGYYIAPSMRVISLFSAPNYTATYKNAAAVLNVNEYLEMNFIFIVPETPDCRDLIQIGNVVWSDAVETIPKWGEEEFVDDQPERLLRHGPEDDKTKTVVEEPPDEDYFPVAGDGLEEELTSP